MLYPPHIRRCIHIKTNGVQCGGLAHPFFADPIEAAALFAVFEGCAPQISIPRFFAPLGQ